MPDIQSFTRFFTLSRRSFSERSNCLARPDQLLGTAGMGTFLPF